MPHRHRAGHRARLAPRPEPAALIAILALAVALIAGACAVAATPAPSAVPTATAGSGASVTPAGSVGPSVAPAASPSRSAAASSSLPGQTSTAWGRIWDALPAVFPRYPGASPATATRGAVSAEFTVQADAAAVMSAMRTALEAAKYTTVTLSGPMEDGSRTLESTGPAAGCKVQTTVGPLGGLTHIAVLFGASCPFN